MISVKRLILACLFTTGAVFGIANSHGVHFHGASVTPTQIQFAGDNPPLPPNL